VVRGAVRVWRGPLILGEVSLAISIAPSLTAEPPPAVADSAARYRRIFPSYSHADGAIVNAFTEMARTFGDEYLRDVVALRAGERWRDRLPELIEEADIFQLFWSSNSMRSRYCREEWEYAVSLGRPAAAARSPEPPATAARSPEPPATQAQASGEPSMYAPGPADRDESAIPYRAARRAPAIWRAGVAVAVVVVVAVIIVFLLRG